MNGHAVILSLGLPSRIDCFRLDHGEFLQAASPRSYGCRIAPFCCHHSAVDVDDKTFIGAGRICYRIRRT